MPSNQGPRDPRDDDRRPGGRPEEDGDDGLTPIHEQRPASDYYDDDPYDDYDEAPRLLARRLLQAGVALLAVAVFLGVVWYAYTWGSRTAGHQGDLPVVRAEEGPEKVKPEDPGGMEVPHQDKLVMNEREADGAGEEVERLLPPPETPQPPETGTPGTATPQAGQTGAGPEATGEDEQAPADAEGIETTQEVAELPEAEVPGQDMPDAEEADPAAEPADAAPDAPVPPGRKPQAPDTRTAARQPERTPAPEQDAGGGGTASGAYAVQLAAFRTEDSARTAWRRLQERFPDLLGGRELLLQRAEIADQGTFWRVRTGPFAAEAEAERLCRKLKGQEQPCLAVRR